MSTNQTITKAKTSFLLSQVRLLTNPLQPTPSLSGEDTLPEKALATLIEKVNQKIRAHNRLVFSAASQRHIAEQIDTLYWNEIIAATRTRDADTVWIARDVDLSETVNLAGLPESLAEVCTGIEDEEESVYRERRERAVGLATRRDELRKKLEGLRVLRALLRPFEDAKGDVQPNLVTKDGELAKEMERMRVLIARVTAGVGQGSNRDGGLSGRNSDAQQLVVLDDQQRLAKVMDLG